MINADGIRRDTIAIGASAGGVEALIELLQRLPRHLPASILLNSAVCYEYPDIVEKIKQRGDDVLGHGRTNAETLRGMWEDDERRVIQECVDVLTKHVGVRPTGWMGSGAAETSVTPDLLKECGFTHLLDWPCGRPRLAGS